MAPRNRKSVTDFESTPIESEERKSVEVIPSSPVQRPEAQRPEVQRPRGRRPGGAVRYLYMAGAVATALFLIMLAAV